MTPRTPAGPPVGGLRRAAFALVEGFVRDALVNTAAVVSLAVVLVGVSHRHSGWGVAAVILGGAGLPLPWLSLSHRRPTRILRMVVRGVLLADLTLLVAVLYAA